MFRSKEEIVEYHFEILFQEFTNECEQYESLNLSRISYVFFQFFYNHQDFVNILISNNMTYLLQQQFEIYLIKIKRLLNVDDDNINDDYTIAYISGALTQILIHWFQKSFDINIDKLSEITQSIIIGETIQISI